MNAALPSSTRTYPSMPDISLSVSGIEKLLTNLDTHKDCGPDEIQPRILKELSIQIAPILLEIFRASLSSGFVPSNWKKANVVPIYKKVQKHPPKIISPFL
jgi:hypothetical protein